MPILSFEEINYVLNLRFLDPIIYLGMNLRILPTLGFYFGPKFQNALAL